MFWRKKKEATKQPSQVLTISTDRPTLEITLQDGSTVRWQYDVVSLKLKIQSIQEATGRTVPDQNDLEQFRDVLILLGMPDCNVDIALRVWSLVLIQFQQIAVSIAKQVEQCR